jgi:uncharacterized protein
MEYRRRVIDEELDELFPALPAIAIDGPKAVGKTATALQRARTVHRLDDAAQASLAKADPARLVSDAPPVLIDEWQRVPSTWDAVRRAVDRGAAPGSFLLTGSATPRNPPTHSGAGRIVTLRLRPMTLHERGVGDASVSLRELLAGSRPAIEGDSAIDLEGYATEICASGFPGLRGLSDRALRARLSGYVDRVVDTDIREAGVSIRHPATLKAWLTAYAAATATTASFERIRDGATAGQVDKPAKTTVIPYREALARLWILDPVPGWTTSRNELRRLTQSPKHHLADPALAATLLGKDPATLLAPGADHERSIPREGTLVGALFESLATLSVRVFAQAAEAHVSHLRTRGGEHEIDLIVQGRDGGVVALEVKLAGSVDDDDVKHLRWLAGQLGDRLFDQVLLTTGPHAYRRPDGVAVVPLALLGP